MPFKKIPIFRKRSRLLKPAGRVIGLLPSIWRCSNKAGPGISAAGRRAKPRRQIHLVRTLASPEYLRASPEHPGLAVPQLQWCEALDRLIEQGTIHSRWNLPFGLRGRRRHDRKSNRRNKLSIRAKHRPSRKKSTVAGSLLAKHLAWTNVREFRELSHRPVCQ